LYKAVIIDDEHHSRVLLQSMMEKYCPEITVLGIGANIHEGIEVIEANKPDLVFLDIEMPGGTGFELLRYFSKPWFNVIFITAYDHYAIKAIKFSALDYLLKPIDIEELQNAVKKVRERSNNDAIHMLLQNANHSKPSQQTIGLSTSDGLEFVSLTDIQKIEASGPYSYFWLKGGRKIMVSKNLKEYELLLKEHGFFRVHNSFIVNLEEVKMLVKSEGGYVLMKDDTTVAISPKKKDEFLLQMKQRMI